jgi:hypothetical protein
MYMLTRLWLILFFALMLFFIWRLVHGVRPHRGLHAAMETVCLGALLCLGLGLLAKPFGASLPSGPLPSLFAGTLGLPGAALAFWVGKGL